MTRLTRPRDLANVQMTEMSNKPAVIAVMPQDKDPAADDDPEPSLNIFIEYEQWKLLEGAEAVIARAHEATTSHETVLGGREVTVLLSSDEAIAALNGSFRGKAKPTNVLSFPFAAPSFEEDGGAPLGDIIIAYETVIREAGDENKVPLDHLAHLTVHGLLHLAGYGHENDEDAERMEELERSILAAIGISDPYHIVEDEAPIPAQ